MRSSTDSKAGISQGRGIAASPPVDDPGNREASGAPRPQAPPHPFQTTDLVRIGLVAFATLASWLLVGKSLFSFDVIALAAILVGGYRS
jgi:hypothetical protein